MLGSTTTRDIIKCLQQNGYQDLTETDIEEEYSPAIYTSDDYLKTKRIELYSIAAKVGAAGLEVCPSQTTITRNSTGRI
jgi:hypothetical protein